MKIKDLLFATNVPDFCDAIVSQFERHWCVSRRIPRG